LEVSTDVTAMQEAAAVYGMAATGGGGGSGGAPAAADYGFGWRGAGFSYYLSPPVAPFDGAAIGERQILTTEAAAAAAATGGGGGSDGQVETTPELTERREEPPSFILPSP